MFGFDRFERDDGGMGWPAVREFDLRQNWQPVMVGVLCGYEVTALLAHSDRLPPLTQIAWRLRVHKLGRFALWLVFGWLTEHLYGEGR